MLQKEAMHREGRILAVGLSWKGGGGGKSTECVEREGSQLFIRVGNGKKGKMGEKKATKEILWGFCDAEKKSLDKGTWGKQRKIHLGKRKSLGKVDEEEKNRLEKKAVRKILERYPKSNQVT